jgi:carboxyl-terminal processing protease
MLKTSKLKVNVSSSGYVRTTIGKFYRVTGQSHQKEGVQPDILLPESIVYERFGEDTYPNPLEKDVLDKDSYFKPLTEIPKETIIANSKKRVTESAAFQQLLEENRLLRKMETDAFTVSMETMYPLVKIMQTAGDYKEETEAPYKAKMPTYLQSFATKSESMKTFNESMLEVLETNIYVREAYQIGLELISQ